MKGSSFILTLIFAQWLMGCALTRSQKSGYYYGDIEVSMTRENLERERMKLRKKRAARELGISSVGQANEGDSALLENRMQLRQMEAQLRADAEKAQYYHYRPLMRTDAEKIQFLMQPGMAAREQWAQARGLSGRNERFPAHVVQAIDSADVVMGMSQAAVKQSWGDPIDKAVAGNPVLKNEKWTYRKEVPTVDGYISETRILYFEAGRVVGWEKK